MTTRPRPGWSFWTLTFLVFFRALSNANPVDPGNISARSDLPTVDLGYAIYRGYLDNVTGLNNFRGIQYAAPPVGNLRWQKPQPPTTQTEPIILSAEWPPVCPQSPAAPFTPSRTPDPPGNEDCLYLSVIAPPAAKELPILFFIHGGGYGSGNEALEFNDLMKNNGNGFVYVSIQYRLGAFGFLSSAAVHRHGVANAGLWDVKAALEWVNNHIGGFGGDPSRITIAGESAGGGAVMTLVMAEGGTWGTSLFQNALAASPYLPQQYNYDGPLPESTYAGFAIAAGCLDENTPADDATVFACLQAADSETLQKANQKVNSVGRYGSWSFLPVTDGEFLRDLPSVQLRSGSVNGARFLSGVSKLRVQLILRDIQTKADAEQHNANEGAVFMPAVVDESAFTSWLKSSFPVMSDEEFDKLAETYAIDPVVPGQPWFATLGDSGPTALNQSSFAVGYQQAADNLFSEATFVCPSYWLSDAFGRSGGNSWHYQFSVPPAQHAGDLNAYWVDNGVHPGDGTLTEHFRLGMQRIWGNFIIRDDPRLSDELIGQLAGEGGVNGKFDAASSRSWKTWCGGANGSPMLNLNMTGGIEVTANVTYAYGATVNLTQYAEPGLSVAWSLVDAYTWEGGRGRRCDVLAELGPSVPE